MGKKINGKRKGNEKNGNKRIITEEKEKNQKKT